MGAKTVVWCLTSVVLYFVIADGYVVVVNVSEDNSVKGKNNEIEVVILDKERGSLVRFDENWYNWYSPTIPSETDSDTTCDTASKGYKYFDSTQSCYKVHTERATWAVAEMTCIREGGQLAVINSDDEAWVLVSQYPSGFRVVHIGVVQMQGTWKTIDRKTLSEAGYDNWNEGEPNNIIGDQYCGSMYPDGSLDDISCNDETAFICEKAPDFHSQPHLTSTTEPQNNSYQTESDSTSIQQETLSTDRPESVTEGDDIYEDSTQHESSDRVPNPDEIENECGTTDKGYKYYHTNTQTCYKFHYEYATWDDAVATCAREGGRLGFIESTDDAYIFHLGFNYGWSLFYLGFHLVEGSWVTIHGKKFSERKFGSWHEGQPTTDYGNQMCGAMYYFQSYVAIPCHYRMPFICQKDRYYQVTVDTEAHTNLTGDDTTKEGYSKEKKPTSVGNVGIQNVCITNDTDYTFLEGTQSCYKVHKEMATWSDAEAACVREGGHLAVIHSPDNNELVFIKRSLFHRTDPHQVFLGFYLKDGSWVTIQGQTLAEMGYENWSKDQPVNFNGEQYCGSLIDDGTLKGVGCNTELAFVCQKYSIFNTPGAQSSDHST